MQISQYTNIAFISYKREDEEWAKWLQKKLEHYKLPTEIRKKNPDMEFVRNPRHVFKDTTDLSGGVLAKAIKEGLDSSKFLIVICSPHAAKSEWVCKEVQDFIDSGREEYIIPFIIDGEPYAKDPKDECFPEALKALAGERELLGININENGRESAAVKVVARLFKVRFDTLWDRFKREERRRRIWTLSIVFTIIVCLLGIVGYGYWSYNKMQLQDNEIKEKQDEAFLEKIISISNYSIKAASEGRLQEAKDTLSSLSTYVDNFSGRKEYDLYEKAYRYIYSLIGEDKWIKFNLKEADDIYLSYDESHLISRKGTTISVYDVAQFKYINSFDVQSISNNNEIYPLKDCDNIAIVDDDKIDILDLISGERIESFDYDDISKMESLFREIDYKYNSFVNYHHIYKVDNYDQPQKGNYLLNHWLRTEFSVDMDLDVFDYNPDYNLIVAYSHTDDEFRVYDMLTNEILLDHFPSDDVFNEFAYVAFTHDNKKVVCIDHSGDLCICNCPNCELIAKVPGGQFGDSNKLFISNDDRYAIIYTYHNVIGEVRAIDLNTSEEKHVSDDPAYNSILSKNNDIFIIDNLLYKNYKPLASFEGHDLQFKTVSSRFSTNRHSFNGTIALLEEGTEKWTINYSNDIDNVYYSQQDDYVLLKSASLTHVTFELISINHGCIIDSKEIMYDELIENKSDDLCTFGTTSSNYANKHLFMPLKDVIEFVNKTLR